MTYFIAGMIAGVVLCATVGLVCAMVDFGKLGVRR